MGLPQNLWAVVTSYDHTGAPISIRLKEVERLLKTGSGFRKKAEVASCLAWRCVP